MTFKSSEFSLSNKKTKTVLLFSRVDREFPLLKAKLLRENADVKCLLIKPGDCFRQLGKDIFQIRVAEIEDIFLLFKAINEDIRKPTQILYLWNYDCSPLDYVYHGNPEYFIHLLYRNLDISLNAVDKLMFALAVQELNYKPIISYFHHGSGVNLQPQNYVINDRIENATDYASAVSLNSIICTQRFTKSEQLVPLLEAELMSPRLQYSHVACYQSDEKEVFEIKDLRLPIGIASNSVCIVTDSGSGNGKRFALRLADKFDGHVVLLHGAVNLPVNGKIEELSCNFSSVNEVSEVLESISKRYGNIKNIFHFSIQSDSENIAINLEMPVLLDELSKEYDLDNFVLVGPSQQCGNFSKAFALLRHELKAVNKRSGQTSYHNIEGLWEKISFNVAVSEEKASSALLNVEELRLKLGSVIAGLVADILKIDEDEISMDYSISLEPREGMLHFNSIMLTDLAVRVEKRTGLRLTTAIFFQTKTLQAFVDYLMSNHLEALSNKFNLAQDVPSIGSVTASSLTAILTDTKSAGTSSEVYDRSSTAPVPVQNEWNETKTEYPSNKGVHQLFGEWAEKKPSGFAVSFEGKKMSYAELDMQSNKLANYLINLGIKPGTLVGMYVERSFDLLVSMLGIMKSGGAYIPMDPDYPRERLAYIADDAQLSFVVTQSCVQNQFPDGVHRKILVDSTDVAQASSAKVDQVLASDHLAYIIYTSGSTGKPKGVQISHKSFCNLLLSMKQRPGFSEYDSILAVTTVSFDISGLELMLPLVCGGRIDLISNEVARDGLQLRDAIEQCKSTVVQATPSTWQMLLAANWTINPKLKILCGGEPLSESLKNALLDGGVELWNMYGPTETTIWSSIAKMERSIQVNVGKPIANTQFYILDEGLNQVSVGVKGELYIGGDGVALKYNNKETLTAERFVPNKFSNQKIARLYRTGDLARYLPDGSVDISGRIDSQIKIRGNRVELGEVENQLLREEGVLEATVVLREPNTIQGYLAAFIVGHNLSPIEIGAKLKGVLPQYMIPSRIIVLNSLPLTPNGKVDRQYLTNIKISEIQATYEASPEEQVKTEKVVQEYQDSRLIAQLESWAQGDGSIEDIDALLEGLGES